MKIATGRLSQLSLTNSEIIVGINFDDSERVKEILRDYETYILYPGDDVHYSESLPELGKKNKRAIFVIDGTWPCAKKMMKLSTCLHSLPRISFHFRGVSRFSIKAQPGEYCLSTIESISALLEEMAKAGHEELMNVNKGVNSMRDMLDFLVEQQIRFASDETISGYRKRAYKKAQDKQSFKKWQKRSLFFKG